MVDAFQDLSIPDLFIDDDLTIGDDLVFSSDSAVITFGADGDTTLTHTDGSGLTLNSTNKLMFNDASQFIQGSSATVLSLGATDEIDLTATAIDINGNADVSGTLNVAGNFTSLGIDDNADATAITIDSSENVLVGKSNTTFSDNGIELRGSNGGARFIRSNAEPILMNRTGSGGVILGMYQDGTVKGEIGVESTGITFNESSADLDFRVESNGNTHALFVDAGNEAVLVGKSTTALATAGLTLGIAGFASLTRDGAEPLSLNRLTDAGKLAVFYQAGTEFGSISKSSTRFTIEGPDNPIRIVTGTSNIQINHDTHVTVDTAGAERVRINTGEMVVNEDSNDYDFRVESNGNTHMLFVDGGNNKVGIGTTSIDAEADALHVVSSGTNTVQIDGTSTHELYSYHDSGGVGWATGADSSYGELLYLDEGSSRVVIYAAGNATTFFTDAATIVNDASRDHDFRVESNDNTHMLFVDGGSNQVHVATPGVGPSNFNVLNHMSITSGAGAQYLLMGNQDSGGANNPSLIISANGTLLFGNGDSWSNTIGGTFTERFRIADTEVVVNESSLNQDFRVESDSNANGLLYDAGTQKLSMNGTYLGSDVGFCINGISTDSIACLELNGDRSTSSTVNAIRMYCAGTEVGTIDTLRDGADNNAAMRFFTGNSGTLTEGFKLTAAGQPIFAVARNDTTSDAANMNIRSSDGLVRRSTSSRRYKNTITDATHGLTELLKLRSVTYKGNNDGDRLFGGLIAEEVHDAGLTEFVQYNSDDEPDALAYGHMVSLCIKAIQEQQALIETLQAEVAALKGG
jgi:hypothetical protein